MIDSFYGYENIELRRMICRTADIIILMFDFTRKSSLDVLEKIYTQLEKVFEEEYSPIHFFLLVPQTRTGIPCRHKARLVIQA